MKPKPATVLTEIHSIKFLTGSIVEINGISIKIPDPKKLKNAPDPSIGMTTSDNKTCLMYFKEKGGNVLYFSIPEFFKQITRGEFLCLDPEVQDFLKSHFSNPVFKS